MTNYPLIYCEPFIDWFIFHFQVVVFQPLIGAWHHRGRPRPGALEKLDHGNVIKIHRKVMGKCTHIIQHCYPMVITWFLYGSYMVILWLSYGYYMVLIWFIKIT
jgi:hypothetical protein